MDKEDISSNPSNNRHFSDVLDSGMSRRMILKGSLAAAATGFFGSSAALAATGGKKGPNGSIGQNRQNGLVNFQEVSLDQFANSPISGQLPVVSDDYELQVLIPWGTPLKSGITPYEGDPINRPTAAEQEHMIGIGHDGMHFFPLNRTGTRGVLCINHEYGTNFHVFGESRAPNSLEEVRRSQHVHGVAVVEIAEDRNGRWDLVLDSPYNRRITPNTEMEFSGPVPFALGSPIYDNGVVPKGTVNNCANGFTPWGTYLTCEENFDGYFGDGPFGGAWTQTEADARYSVSDDGRYSWFLFDERFDLSSLTYANENKRFGWIVEIDPMNPGARPVKRTALGRIKHEGIALTVGRGGRVVGYMGDDQAGDYIYKFVSDSNWKSMRAQGMSPLDHGKLYVARFNDDGSGDWLELTIDNPALAAKFSSQAEVLTYARISADLLGATPMNRPEWTTVAPNGDVYCTLTNSGGQALEGNAANPVETQRDGHIIRWRDSAQHTGLTFSWDIYVISSTTHGTEESFSDPDGLWIDPDGRVFIQTDGSQKDGLQDQLIIGNIFGEKDENGLEFKRLLVGVSSDEITGIAYIPGRETMFINIQHPGNGSPTSTNFPAPFDGTTIPRDSTLVLRRKGGGVVGS